MLEINSHLCVYYTFCVILQRDSLRAYAGVWTIGHGTKGHQASFYRAMHVMLARYCYRKLSVRPSVRLPETL